MSKPASLYIDFRQRNREWLLSASWLLGLLLGAVGRSFWSPVSTAVSFTGSRLSAVLPCLCVFVSLVLAWGMRGRWMSLFAGLLAASFSWTAMGLRLSFGTAGWLLWQVSLFGELSFFPFLFFLWLRLLSGRRFMWAVFLCLGVAAVLSLADLCLVMPFAAFLIESK